MKSFKGSSNKLVAVIGFQSAREYRAPLPIAHSAQAIHIGTEAALYSARQAPFAPFRVTTNKLEKVLLLIQSQSHVALIVVL